MRQHRAPGMDEVVADDEIRRIRTVRIDRDGVGILVHLVRRRTALNAAEIEVRLVVEAPQLIGDERAVYVGIEWRVGVDMDDRRHPAVIGLVHFRIDAEGTLLEAPIDPHTHVVMDLAVAALDRNALRQLKHVPDPRDPGARAGNDVVAGDAAPTRTERRHRAGVRAELEARDLDAGHDAYALGLCLVCQAIHRLGIVGVAALFLVQNRGDAFRLPIVEQALHIFLTVNSTLDKRGLVADRLLLLIDRGDILMHTFGADLHVAHRMIGVGLGVALPDLDRLSHELAHGRLEVVVADDAAGDARGTGGDRGLIHNKDVLAGASAGLFQHLGEVEGGAQPVNSGADDGIFDRLRDFTVACFTHAPDPLPPLKTYFFLRDFP